MIPSELRKALIELLLVGAEFSMCENCEITAKVSGGE